MGKSGKVGESEWTTLAAIVRLCCWSRDLSVVSLATGTKCVTGTKSAIGNNIISDCHAESLLKRAFKRYLLSKIAAGKGCSTANTLHPQVHDEKELIRDQKLLHQHEDYYLFVSQLPCGTIDRYEGAPRHQSLYHVHRKPGKGEPCLKASCTDKIAKWLILGLQGRKLMGLIHNPIRLKGIVIGNCVRVPEFDEDLFGRRVCPPNDTFDTKQSSHLFPPVTGIHILFDESFQKECLTRDTGKRACPSAIVSWMEGSERKVEVIVAGRRQGSSCKSHASNKLLVSSHVINSDIEAAVSSAPYRCGLSQQMYEEEWQRLLALERFMGYDRDHD